MDRQYLKTPFYARRIWLLAEGYLVSRSTKADAVDAWIYRRPNTSKRSGTSGRSLLKGVRVDQVPDITYIPMARASCTW